MSAHENEEDEPPKIALSTLYRVVALREVDDHLEVDEGASYIDRLSAWSFLLSNLLGPEGVIMVTPRTAGKQVQIDLDDFDDL